MKIEAVKTRWVLDSLGKPTVEVDIYLDNGAYGRSSVSSSLSPGHSEASELKDSYPVFGGYGVSRALNIIEHSITPVILGLPADNQEAVDAKLIALDGTSNKKTLGANTCLAVSIAVAKAAAQANKTPLYSYIAELASNDKISLPMPIFSMLGGGLHAQKTTDIESILMWPSKARDIHTAIRIGVEINQSLKTILCRREYALVRASDGSYSPVGVRSNKQAIDLVCEATEHAGYVVGDDVWMGVDIAADHLYDKGHYKLTCDKTEYGQKAFAEWLISLVAKYPIKILEDPYHEEAWADWARLTKNYGKTIQIVGDDLIATSDRRLRKAITKKAANTILIKPNQIGTLSETIQTYKLAKKTGWKSIVASRAGETQDSYLAHLAVGLGCGQAKLGALSGISSVKYNELLRISDSIQSDLIA